MKVLNANEERKTYLIFPSFTARILEDRPKVIMLPHEASCHQQSSHKQLHRTAVKRTLCLCLLILVPGCGFGLRPETTKKTLVADVTNVLTRYLEMALGRFSGSSEGL